MEVCLTTPAPHAVRNRCRFQEISGYGSRHREPSAVTAWKTSFCNFRDRPKSVRLQAGIVFGLDRNPQPLLGPTDGHRGRARKARQEALSADDAGQVKSKGSPSRNPKSPGFPPIRPQDEVSENDSLSSITNSVVRLGSHPYWGSQTLKLSRG